MTQIIYSNLGNINVNVNDFERTVDTVGEFAFDEKLVDVYRAKGYDLKPKSKEETKARGEKNFNGLSTSFSHFTVEGDVMNVTLSPMRFLFKKAMEDLCNGVGTGLSLEERMRISPNQANVSLIAPFKKNGEYFLLSQVKGDAIGSGQIHAGLVAGGIDYIALKTDNSIVTSLRQECLEELGMDLDSLDSSCFSYVLDESELGGVNFGSVARNVDIYNVLSAYEKSIGNKFGPDELEVAALASLPVKGVSVIPLERGVNGLNNVEIYLATQNGIKTVNETRGVRPYTESVLDFVSDRKNLTSILDKAGF